MREKGSKISAISKRAPPEEPPAARNETLKGQTTAGTHKALKKRPPAPANETLPKGPPPAPADVQGQGKPTSVGDALRKLQSLPRKAITTAPQVEFKAPVCPICRGSGYELYGAGELARARICECQGACTLCGDRGYQLRSREGGYIYHAPCVCRGLRTRIERFNHALVPSHYSAKDLDNFEQHEGTRHVYEHIRTYARGFPADKSGILLVGPPGVGKTHLVVGILKTLTLEKGVRCLFKDFFLLLSEVKEAYETGRFETEVLRPLGEVDVLVVDELGKGRSNSDWEQGLLDEIICKRYNRMKTTLLTTNFPLEAPEGRAAEPRRKSYGASNRRDGLGNLTASNLIPTLEERIGERIFSRLKQMCIFLRVEAADYRRNHSAARNPRSR